MRQRLKLLYPFLFVVIPILSVVTHSKGHASLSEIAVALGVVLAACGLLYSLGALVFGWSNPLVPLLVLVVIAWFYESIALVLWARQAGSPWLEPAWLLIPAAATVAIVWWLPRRTRILDRAATFLTLTGAVLAVWLGARLVMDQVRARSTVRNSVLARELAKPVPVRAGGASRSDGPLRDIYLIVLDEYANSSVVQERFDFDNRMFEDSLRQLGFTIPKMVRSNYVQTMLSLPSLLNFSHLNRLALELGARATDPTLPNYLVENNRTVAFLQERGYRFLFFPSQWWISTRHNRHADWEFQAWSGFDPAREATRSEMERRMSRTTALHVFPINNAYDADHVKRTLHALEQVPARAEPTFAFAHILNPHYPYVFDSDCRPFKEGSSGTNQGKRARYVIQIQCLNHLVLSTVARILQHSTVPPIILLQGDHGTSTLNYSWAPTAARVSPAQARERFGAFGAYYLPAGGGRLFEDSVTIVNVFRKVLRYYFDADIPLAPDHLFMSLEQKPYAFEEFQPSAISQIAP